MLIEVMMSALLVALVVVATLTGFDNVSRATAEERRHAQAAVLAAQAQEQLRSDSGAALSEMYGSPHNYKRTLSGTIYTVTQEAKPVNSTATGTGCSATETTAQSGINIQITSTVSWYRQVATSRPPVQQSSIVTPPIGSTLEVDVQNGSNPLAGVSGVTVVASYAAAESKALNTLTATTGTAGCVLFTAIPATKATVAIKEKLGYVTKSGLLKVPTREVSLAPTVTTHYTVTYNEGGRIAGEFSYEGKTGSILHEGRKETVVGDTFVAYNGSMLAEPEFELGATGFEYEAGGEQHYKALTGAYAATASTPAGTLYPSGDLFAFPSPAKWQVYAGDCLKDNIATVTATTEKLKPESELVEAGKTRTVKVPLSYVLVTTKKGNAYKPGATDPTGYAAKISNRECESEKALPNNASAANLAHSQKTNGEGHLEHPFQGYGKYELCLYNSTLKNRYKWTYNNTTVAGTSISIFPSELSETQWKEQEKANSQKWKEEEAKFGKPTNAERKAKEKAEKEERLESEAKRGYSVEGGQASC